MSLGNPIKLKSVQFREAVRFPGSSQTATYIPAVDYPLAFYPEAGLVEARLREGSRSVSEHFTRRMFYPLHNVRDMQIDDSEVATAITANADGALMMPSHPMRPTAGGGFERVTEEEAAPAKDGAPAEAPAPAKRKPGRPPKAKAEAVAEPPRPPPVTVAHPANRAAAGGAGGGA